MPAEGLWKLPKPKNEDELYMKRKLLECNVFADFGRHLEDFAY